MQCEAETNHTRGGEGPTCELTSCSVAASAGSGKSEACMSATMIDAILAARAAPRPRNAFCRSEPTTIAPPMGV
eukprot:scaffold17710_cov92-Phaeocystis_antarctica.AAC.5